MRCIYLAVHCTSFTTQMTCKYHHGIPLRIPLVLVSTLHVPNCSISSNAIVEDWQFCMQGDIEQYTCLLSLGPGGLAFLQYFLKNPYKQACTYYIHAYTLYIQGVLQFVEKKQKILQESYPPKPTPRMDLYSSILLYIQNRQSSTIAGTKCCNSVHTGLKREQVVYAVMVFTGHLCSTDVLCMNLYKHCM